MSRRRWASPVSARPGGGTAGGSSPPAGLEDRPSAPIRRTRVPAKVEDRIVYLRRSRRWGPDRIAAYMGQSPSTVYRVLVRRGMNRLDRPTGRQIRRYEHPHPGSLVHVDVKKLGRIPRGGGAGGPTGARRRCEAGGIGYACIHAAVDDHSRLAYVEVLDDEGGPRRRTSGAGRRAGSGPRAWSSSG